MRGEGYVGRTVTLKLRDHRFRLRLVVAPLRETGERLVVVPRRLDARA